MLIDEFKTDFILMNNIRIPDGEGGFASTWSDGPIFSGALTRSSTTLARIAEQQGVTGIYTLTTAINVKLAFPDVIKRVNDGAIFRIRSKEGEAETPRSSSLNLAQYEAESWKL